MTTQKMPAIVEFPDAAWFRSTYTGSEGQACVVVADVRTSHDVIAVRDSKDDSGPAIPLGAAAFSAFVRHAALDVFST